MTNSISHVHILGVVLKVKEEFCENIRLCENAMYHLAYSIVGNEADASEIISESIYRAYKSYATLKNKAAFKTWMLRIVHNTAIEISKKNAMLIPVEQVEKTTGEDICDDITTKMIVRDAVESLKRPYRTVTVLFYYENLSIAEIARITNNNVLTVRQQLSRSRKMLSKKLKEDLQYE